MLNVRDNACARCRALGDDTDIVNDSQSVGGGRASSKFYLRNIIRENAENSWCLGARFNAKSRDGKFSFTEFYY